MMYRDDDLNQAIFAATLLGHPWLRTSVNRESLREGRAVAPQITINILSGGPLPERVHRQLIDKVINSSIQGVIGRLQQINEEARRRGQDLDTYCRDTLKLQHTIPELVRQLPDNPKLLAEAVIAWTAFSEALTPKEITGDPLLAVTKGISEWAGSYAGYATLLEQADLSRLVAAIIPEGIAHPQVNMLNHPPESLEDRSYAITFPGLRAYPVNPIRL